MTKLETGLLCTINHNLLDIHEGFTIKCTNRMCYEPKLKNSDYCLCHHKRDECLEQHVDRCYD